MLNRDASLRREPVLRIDMRNRWPSRRSSKCTRLAPSSLVATAVLALAALGGPLPAVAQVALQEGTAACLRTGRDLLPVPEITRDPGTRTLKAVITMSDQIRRMWFPGRCLFQRVRLLTGRSPVHPNESWPVTDTLAAPLPGPTLRARVGDIVQLTFENQVDINWFSDSWDAGEQGEGCDATLTTDTSGNTVEIYPLLARDSFPNCFHGSSTANIHFHGTHTSPSTTGDNVGLQIRPSPMGVWGLQYTEATARSEFATFFAQCQDSLRTSPGVPTAWPKSWDQLPLGYRTAQEALLRHYDTTAQWQGRTTGPPDANKLWPKNERSINAGEWPSYFVGAFPYCFELPEYSPATWPPNSDQLQMGQAPGTHWYHAHKHGSTHLNVSNGMAGAFIISGDYDDTLREFYDGQLEEKVLVIQQLGVDQNRRKSSAAVRAPSALSVNGRRQPVVTMRPGEVQMWRIINTAARSGLYFFAREGVEWRQTAQDGVQYHPDNYDPDPEEPAASFYLAAGNRADLLVRTPMETGSTIAVMVRDSINIAGGVLGSTGETTLLTIQVYGAVPAARMPFPSRDEFPAMPVFLEDIEEGGYGVSRTLRFNTVFKDGSSRHTINGEKFGSDVDQHMTLNTVEEWTVINESTIHHPFHIHINPFQVVEVFDPYDPNYQFSNPDRDCYVNPSDQTTWTWKPCSTTQLSAPYIWWDTFAMPAAKSVPNPADPDNADANILVHGHFKMRTRFVDYTGQFVLHCHMLAHEDRGMMQLVEVVSNKPKSEHR